MSKVKSVHVKYVLNLLQKSRRGMKTQLWTMNRATNGMRVSTIRVKISAETGDVLIILRLRIVPSVYSAITNSQRAI